MCEERIVTVVPKHDVVIAKNATWLEDQSEVKVTIPAQTQKIVVCRHLNWEEEMSDAGLHTKAIREVNDYWGSKEDKSNNQVNGKNKATVLGADWEKDLKAKVGKAEIEKERDKLKVLIDSA